MNINWNGIDKVDGCEESVLTFLKNDINESIDNVSLRYVDKLDMKVEIRVVTKSGIEKIYEYEPYNSHRIIIENFND